MKIVQGKTGGEKATVVQGNIVTCDHVTLHKASEENYQLRTTFDFEGVSRETILKFAAETLLIRWRTVFKNADVVDEDTADNQVVKVTDMLKGSKPRMSKKEKFTRTLADMTKEEKLDLIKQLSASAGIEVDLPTQEESL